MRPYLLLVKVLHPLMCGRRVIGKEDCSKRSPWIYMEMQLLELLKQSRMTALRSMSKYNITSKSSQHINI